VSFSEAHLQQIHFKDTRPIIHQTVHLLASVEDFDKHITEKYYGPLINLLPMIMD